MFLLATDLDGTFLAGSALYKNQLYRLMLERNDTLLVFVTGRGLASVQSLLEDPLLPDPAYIIGDVGASIVHGKTLTPVEPIQSGIIQRWPGNEMVLKRLQHLPGLVPQQVPQVQRCSFFYGEGTDLQKVHRVAEELGCEVIVSAGKFVDVLPAGVNKGTTLQQLVNLLGIGHPDVMVAGDTLNDLSLFNTGYNGVVVGAAEPALLEATRHLPQVYQANSAGCGGIIEAMQYFDSYRYYLSDVSPSVTRS